MEKRVWYRGELLSVPEYREAQARVKAKFLRLRSEGRPWLTQFWVAQRMGRSREYVSRVMNGSDRPQRVAMLLFEVDRMLDKVEAGAYDAPAYGLSAEACP